MQETAEVLRNFYSCGVGPLAKRIQEDDSNPHAIGIIKEIVLEMEFLVGLGHFIASTVSFNSQDMNNHG
ncbi:hypothetical protein L6452_03548 [Arctium lappa]|uniref:Uncharacterized protein n=1 Tax=Arctium lappa TaxID=4217 RepID=A0ACB9FN42_ARCLA|nr:hypothetical protein L6452_03548 [Arctium lappa]